jgi:hypothetical protein
LQAVETWFGPPPESRDAVAAASGSGGNLGDTERDRRFRRQHQGTHTVRRPAGARLELLARSSDDDGVTVQTQSVWRGDASGVPPGATQRSPTTGVLFARRRTSGVRTRSGWRKASNRW